MAVSGEWQSIGYFHLQVVMRGRPILDVVNLVSSPVKLS